MSLHRRTLALALGTLLAVAASSGCGGRQIAPPDDALTEPIEVFEALLSRLEGIGSVRLRGTLEYYGEQGRARVDQVLLAREPGQLRIETLSPFDSTLSVFLIDAGVLTWFDLQRRQYLTGDATAANVARFVPLWMSADDLVRVLFGGPPLDAIDPDPDTYTLRWDERAGAYRLEMPLLTGGALVLRVEHRTWLLRSARRLDEDREIVFELRAGEPLAVPTDAGEVWMPSALRFRMPSERLDMSLELDRVDVNPELPDALFRLAPPNGVTVERL